MFRVCHTVLSVPSSLVVTCWEIADLLALLCVMFSCVFVTFPYDVLGWVWYLIVSFPDLCFLSYFDTLIVALKEIFEKNNFEKVSRRQQKHEKLPSMHTVYETV